MIQLRRSRGPSRSVLPILYHSRGLMASRKRSRQREGEEKQDEKGEKHKSNSLFQVFHRCFMQMFRKKPKGARNIGRINVRLIYYYLAMTLLDN